MYERLSDRCFTNKVNDLFVRLPKHLQDILIGLHFICSLLCLWKVYSCYVWTVEWFGFYTCGMFVHVVGLYMPTVRYICVLRVCGQVFISWWG